MVFSSMTFLWIFLPITIGLYFVLPKCAKNILLLIASLIFYAWGEPVYVLLMLASTVCNWIFGLLIGKCVRTRTLFLVLDIIFNLGLLGYFKYSDFLIETINSLFGTQIPLTELALPIGISFFTFQGMSYIIDLYRGQYEPQKNFLNLALYISFFPQLIAGPIVRYIDIREQLENRSVTPEKFMEGVRRFIYGLGKKVIIANTMAAVVDDIFDIDVASLTGALTWVGAIFYTLQIYYDFSGYSDMAIGLGKMFGFEFKENFLLPYSATSIRDFWRKWHVSLSSWFKEYLYIPLGGNRKGKLRTYINLIIVFFVTGLWHGAGFTFILWGLYHGFFIIIERLGLGKLFDKVKPLGLIYTLIVVNFGWVLFRADTLSYAAVFIRDMMMPWKYTVTGIVWQEIIPHSAMLIAVLGVLGSGIIQKILQKSGAGERLKYSYIELSLCAVILVLCFAFLASSSYNPFIYFRF